MTTYRQQTISRKINYGSCPEELQVKSNKSQVLQYNKDYAILATLPDHPRMRSLNFIQLIFYF